MSLALDPTESANPVDADYSSWRLENVPPDGGPLEIRVHPDVIDGITRDILGFPEGEFDGSLGGRREDGDTKVLWIERYQKLETAPLVPEPDTVGFYRGTASKNGFTDTDGPADSLLMAILPDKAGALVARFYLPGNSGKPAKPAFPFRTRPHPKGRRLVPDFDPAAENARPAREFFLESRPVPEIQDEAEPGFAAGAQGFLRRSWPFLAALALIGGAIWVLPQVLSKQVVAPGLPTSVASTRPLGLYVDPSSQNWRIAWNRDATVLRDARLVRLFIHDGDEQNGVDLSPGDLESGLYQYQPRGNDVTFRMEATGADGRVSAESFRLLRTPSVDAHAPSTGPAPRVASPAEPASKTKGPQAIQRVAPVVSSSIRPRIQGKVLIDIRVQVDKRGRVTSAVPASRPRKSIEYELAKSAITAARAWRFDPAVSDGKPVSGTQTLHFVFER